MAKFAANNTNPDGNCILNIYWLKGVPTAALMLFYNGSTPTGLFADFLNISSTSNGLHTRTSLDLIKATSRNFENPTYLRGTLNSVLLPNITAPVLDEVLAWGNYYGTPGVFSSACLVSFGIEPFYWKSIVRPRHVAAYPHDVYVSPFLLFFAWPHATEDRAGSAAIRDASAGITQAVINNGQKNLTGTVLYTNYALGETKLESLHDENLLKIKSLSQIRSEGVFLNTGGFKFV